MAVTTVTAMGEGIRGRLAALPLALVLVLAACSASGTASDAPATAQTTATTAVEDDPLAFPDPDWEVVAPEEAGMAAGPLDDLAALLEATGAHCMIVARDGRIVEERYWNDRGPDDEQEIFSASKSVTATLVGIAQDLGHLDIDQPASDFITEWQGTDSEDITVRNLLANDSGRSYDFETDYLVLGAAEDRTALAIGLGQQHEPGTHWEYNNAAIQTLEAVLERATGQDVEEFAREHLFEPIGMSSWIRRDPAGNPATYMGVQASCRDMARFGHLALAEGRWGNEQVVSEAWMAEATAPSQDLNHAYGYLWWLNADGGWLIPVVAIEGEGWFWEGAPPDAFAALGFGNQIVLVMPTEGVVVTRGGPAMPTARVEGQGANLGEIAALVTRSIEGGGQGP